MHSVQNIQVRFKFALAVLAFFFLVWVVLVPQASAYHNCAQYTGSVADSCRAAERAACDGLTGSVRDSCLNALTNHSGGGTGQNPPGTGQNPPGTGQNPGPCPSGTLCNPLQSQTIPEFLLRIIDVLLVFALPVIIFFIIYAGFLFVTAGGDEHKVSDARSALTWAVIGGVVILGARLIITVIQGTVSAL